MHQKGPDRHGATKYTFAPGPEPYNGFAVKVPPEREGEFAVFLEAVGAAKRDALARDGG